MSISWFLAGTARGWGYASLLTPHEQTPAMLWPLAVVLPLCVLGAWIAGSLLVRAFVLRREGARTAEKTADRSRNAP